MWGVRSKRCSGGWGAGRFVKHTFSQGEGRARCSRGVGGAGRKSAASSFARMKASTGFCSPDGSLIAGSDGREQDMIRAFVSVVALAISMLGHVGLGASSAVAQGASRKDCAASDPACSSMIPGFAAMGSRVLAQKGEQDGAAVQRAAMVVSPLTLAEPATRAHLRVQVVPTEGLPQNSFVRIRGLPPSITVPNGHSIASGSWAVPLFALPDVAISLPEGAQGWSEVALALVAPDGKVLAEAKTRLVVASRSWCAPRVGVTSGAARR